MTCDEIIEKLKEREADLGPAGRCNQPRKPETPFPTQGYGRRDPCFLKPNAIAWLPEVKLRRSFTADRAVRMIARWIHARKVFGCGRIRSAICSAAGAAAAP
jgi:hypothetical protein